MRNYKSGQILPGQGTPPPPKPVHEAAHGPVTQTMLAFDDNTARTEAWNRFRTDPEWLKLKAIPEYEDKRIVSRITNKLLMPAGRAETSPPSR